MRYGNVLGSRGSLVELLLRNKNAQSVHITHVEMTRFWISFEQAFDLVEFAFQNMEGGEIFVPRIPSMKIVDLFDAITPNAKREIIGIRPGEKIHESLITEAESHRSVEFGNKYFVILPEQNDIFDVATKFAKYLTQGKPLPENFSFRSDNNLHWLTAEELRVLINNIQL